MVVDASALLALLFDEPGAEVVADGATLSTVSLAEVATVLTRHLRNPDKVLDSVRAQVAVEPCSPRRTP